MSQKTLLNYFTKSPAPSTPKSTGGVSTPNSHGKLSNGTACNETSTPKSSKNSKTAPTPNSRNKKNVHVNGSHSETPGKPSKVSRKRIIEPEGMSCFKWHFLINNHPSLLL